MKKRRWLWLMIPVLAGAGVICFFWFRDSEEAKVRLVMEDLCRIVSKSRGENQAVTAFRASRTDSVFAPRCRFNFDVGAFDGVLTPAQITSNIIQIQAMFTRVKIGFSALKVQIPSPGQAEIFFAGSFESSGKPGFSKDVSEVRDVEGILKKDQQGKWKITSLVFHEVLER